MFDFKYFDRIFTFICVCNFLKLFVKHFSTVIENKLIIFYLFAMNSFLFANSTTMRNIFTVFFSFAKKRPELTKNFLIISIDVYNEKNWKRIFKWIKHLIIHFNFCHSALFKEIADLITISYATVRITWNMQSIFLWYAASIH